MIFAGCPKKVQSNLIIGEVQTIILCWSWGETTFVSPSPPRESLWDFLFPMGSFIPFLLWFWVMWQAWMCICKWRGNADKPYRIHSLYNSLTCWAVFACKMPLKLCVKVGYFWSHHHLKLSSLRFSWVACLSLINLDHPKPKASLQYSTSDGWQPSKHLKVSHKGLADSPPPHAMVGHCLIDKNLVYKVHHP